MRVIAKLAPVDLAQVLDDAERFVHQQRGLVHDGHALEVPGDVEARGVAAREELVEPAAHGRFAARDDLAELPGLVEVADNHSRGVPARVGKRGLGLLVFTLAVNDDGVALAAVGTRGLPDLFDQHAGGVILADGDALAHQPALVVVGGAERRDDDNIFGRERVPEQRYAGRVRGAPAVHGIGLALVGLEITQAAAQEILVDEGIVDELREHEDAAPRVLGQGLVGPLDRVFHAEAESEVTGDDIAHGTEIERDRVGGGALVLAGDGLDRDAELRLVEGARAGILRVDGGVAFRRGPELVDEIVLAQVQVGNLDEKRFQLREQRGEGGRQDTGLARQRIEGMENDPGRARLGPDLGEKHPARPAGGIGREIFRDRRVLRERCFQLTGRGGFAADKGEIERRARPAHGELVAGIEGEDHLEVGRSRGGRRHGPTVVGTGENGKARKRPAVRSRDGTSPDRGPGH